jgi:hypothetical protein
VIYVAVRCGVRLILWWLFMCLHGGCEAYVACVVCLLMFHVCYTERALCVCIMSLGCTSLFLVVSESRYA